MKVLIGGASGMIGKELSSFLINQECPVLKLVRSSVVDDLTDISWNIDKGLLDPKKMEGVDAVVHLGGINIADKQWTKRRKRQIKASRVKSTELLAKTLASLENKPKVLIIASGMNIYGNNVDGKPAFTEESEDNGTDFLAEVVREWEAATKPAVDAGIRVCFLRLGAVVGCTGGLLKKVLPIFKLAAGGKLGSGRQMLSWISIDDAVAALWHCLNNESLSGPVNLCTENPVSNKEFTKSLSKAVGMPAFLPMPAFMIRIVFGEMGETLMLSDISCRPEKLLKSGFKFSQPTLRECLNSQLDVDVALVKKSKKVKKKVEE